MSLSFSFLLHHKTSIIIQKETNQCHLIQISCEHWRSPGLFATVAVFYFFWFYTYFIKLWVCQIVTACDKEDCSLLSLFSIIFSVVSVFYCYTILVTIFPFLCKLFWYSLKYFFCIIFCQTFLFLNWLLYMDAESFNGVQLWWRVRYQRIWD